METITNYQLSKFLQLTDEEFISNYLAILELLSPAKTVENPRYRWWNKEPKKLPIKPVKSLSFGEVSVVRKCFNAATMEFIFECIELVTGVDEKTIKSFTIVDFYGIISSIKRDLIEIGDMEANALQSDDFDIYTEAVRANERMAKFGDLNIINSLAGGDLTKWKEIQDMPYLVVFSKLVMDRIKCDIDKEIKELQKKTKEN